MKMEANPETEVVVEEEEEKEGAGLLPTPLTFHPPLPGQCCQRIVERVHPSLNPCPFPLPLFMHSSILNQR